jgi:hypothetical protein
MRPDEREVLDRAIQRVTEQAAKADATVDEAVSIGLDGSGRPVVSIKMIRAELLSVKADLEREIERVVLDCAACGSACSLRRRPRRPGRPLGRTRNRRRTRHPRSSLSCLQENVSTLQHG